MNNCIWGLKFSTYTTGEWLCLISHAWALPNCEKRETSEKFKMKIYVSAGNRTSDPSLFKWTHKTVWPPGQMFCCTYLNSWRKINTPQYNYQIDNC